MERKNLISAHNPVTGPRHLGHYFGAMKSLVECQHEYNTIVVLDDLLAYFMYPKEREYIQNRTLYVVQDFINSGFDIENNNIVLTSDIAHLFLEHMLYYSTVIDTEYCNHLYENSFLGSLKSYQRKELGLSNYPSVTEWLYPQLGIASMALSLNADYFQGGEEIIGYIYIMQEIAENLKRRNGISINIPEYVPSKIGYINGVDGKYMIQKNCVFLSEKLEDLESKIMSINDKRVFQEWYNSLHREDLSKELELSNLTTDAKMNFFHILAEELRPFRENQLTNEFLLDVLDKGKNSVEHLLKESLFPLKDSLNIYSI
ncbi:hypothetical protein [Chryseobacterium potabilaquae]|uniref:Tryptophan--tRNA ligase 2 n=1 Tax=Chryseobacterium potabilaquae TaxID=2675057 RepID=A0A6N4X1T0_9FLAO|nr:hypothetical protein [Chryseobacterium potabilaquae]CAA7194797.1 Tryptophan--tRNA ligase 2 [Chryseobacterium potabilaquae]